MTDPELAADINQAEGRDDAAQLMFPLLLSHASRIRACIRGYRWREGILSRVDARGDVCVEGIFSRGDDTR